MKITAIIFDFDGTLGDSKECGIIATKKAFEQFQLEVPSEEQIEYYMGIPIEQSFKEMSKRELNPDEFDNLLTAFRAFYKQYEEKYLRVFPGTKEMLSSLYADGKPLFVVSSKHSGVLERNLVSLGIAEYFKEVIGSDKVSHYKPHPEGIEYVLRGHQLAADETLMVGDAVFDLQMGKSAGVHTAAVTWGSHSEENLKKEAPDFVAHSNQELLDWIINN